MKQNSCNWFGPGWYTSAGGSEDRDVFLIGQPRDRVPRDTWYVTPRWYETWEQFTDVSHSEHFVFKNEITGELLIFNPQ